MWTELLIIMKRLRPFFLTLCIIVASGNLESHAGDNVFREFGKDAKSAGKQVGKAGKQVGKDIGKAGKKVGKTIGSETRKLFRD